MDGLHTIGGAAWRQTFDGVEYWLEPLVLSDWAILERRALAGRRDPLAVAKEQLAGLEAEEKRALLEAALSQATRATRISAAELLEFTATPAGLAMVLWLAIRKCHPDVTLERATELLDQLGAGEVSRLRADVEGRPEGGNPLKN